MPKLPDSLPPEIFNALREGRQVEAIKLLRKATGLGLVETKAMLDGFLRTQAQAQLAKGKSAANKVSISVASPPRARSDIPPRRAGLSPGEEPRTSAGPWSLLLIVGALVVAGLLLR